MVSLSELQRREIESAVVHVEELEQAGQIREAIDERFRLIERLEALGGPGRPMVAAGLVKQAAALRRTGDLEGAIGLLQQLVARFRGVPLGSKRNLVAEAEFLIGVYWFRGGRHELAVSALETFVEHHVDDPALAEKVALALLLQSQAFDQSALDQRDLQLAALNRLLACFRDSEIPAVRAHVAVAMFSKGAALKVAGRGEEAVKVWGDLFAEFKCKPPLSDPALPFRAQLAKLETALEASLEAEAWESAESLALCLDEARVPESVLRNVCGAVIRAGTRLERIGRFREALTLFDAVRTALRAVADTDLERLRIYAEINAAVTLARLGKFANALDRTRGYLNAADATVSVLSEIIERGRGGESGIPADGVPWALLMKGIVLDSRGRAAEARACFSELLVEFSGESSPVVQRLVDAAREARAGQEDPQY